MECVGKGKEEEKDEWECVIIRRIVKEERGKKRKGKNGEELLTKWLKKMEVWETVLKPSETREMFPKSVRET